MNYSDYKLVVTPGGYVDNEELLPYYNAAYEHWRNIWKRHYERLLGKGGFDPDDFYKQTHVVSIFNGMEVVSQFCCRLVGLDQKYLYEMKYFQDYLGAGVDFLNDKNCRTLMTLEHNAINRNFSQRRSGFKFADAALCLCLKLAESLNVDACSAVPRKITKVQDVLSSMGFFNVHSDLERHNCPVDIMLAYRSEFNLPKGEMAAFTQYLWDNRLSFYEEDKSDKQLRGNYEYQQTI